MKQVEISIGIIRLPAFSAFCREYCEELMEYFCNLDFNNVIIILFLFLICLYNDRSPAALTWEIFLASNINPSALETCKNRLSLLPGWSPRKF